MGWERRAAWTALAAWAGWAIATNLQQARAPYATTYCYGMRGADEVVRMLDEVGGPQSRLLITDDQGVELERHIAEGTATLASGEPQQSLVARVRRFLRLAAS